jgi:hypothetical protein
MPFAETAYLGSPGADVFKDSDNVHHCGLVRVRAVGVGELKLTLQNMQKEFTEVISPITMATINPNISERLSNFTEQRMGLRLETTEINEIFRITRITFYVKPLWISLPG